MQEIPGLIKNLIHKKFIRKAVQFDDEFTDFIPIYQKENDGDMSLIYRVHCPHECEVGRFVRKFDELMYNCKNRRMENAFVIKILIGDTISYETEISVNTQIIDFLLTDRHARYFTGEISYGGLSCFFYRYFIILLRTQTMLSDGLLEEEEPSIFKSLIFSTYINRTVTFRQFRKKFQYYAKFIYRRIEENQKLGSNLKNLILAMEETIWHLISQLLMRIVYIHSMGIAHHDIFSRNLLLQVDETSLVSGYNLSERYIEIMLNTWNNETDKEIFFFSPSVDRMISLGVNYVTPFKLFIIDFGLTTFVRKEETYHKNDIRFRDYCDTGRLLLRTLLFNDYIDDDDPLEVLKKYQKILDISYVGLLYRNHLNLLVERLLTFCRSRSTIRDKTENANVTSNENIVFHFERTILPLLKLSTMQ
ncbi:hypothetical protein SNEBB_006401 [Seison nebaliae]|nr:hypothetical protein SNEBB_006401 [Seison nebaliae]